VSVTRGFAQSLRLPRRSREGTGRAWSVDGRESAHAPFVTGAIAGLFGGILRLGKGAHALWNGSAEGSGGSIHYRASRLHRRRFSWLSSDVIGQDDLTAASCWTSNLMAQATSALSAAEERRTTLAASKDLSKVATDASGGRLASIAATCSCQIAFFKRLHD
jgi:hypothetical protein